jgi:hypothetical protein
MRIVISTFHQRNIHFLWKHTFFDIYKSQDARQNQYSVNSLPIYSTRLGNVYHILRYFRNVTDYDQNN